MDRPATSLRLVFSANAFTLRPKFMPSREAFTVGLGECLLPSNPRQAFYAKTRHRTPANHRGLDSSAGQMPEKAGRHGTDGSTHGITTNEGCFRDDGMECELMCSAI